MFEKFLHSSGKRLKEKREVVFKPNSLTMPCLLDWPKGVARVWEGGTKANKIFRQIFAK